MERLGSKILELHKVGKSFGDKVILDGFTYNFQRKERLGIVGDNGTGKSTFLNLIHGKEEVDRGKVVTGETVVFGYYSQELIKVDEDKKVIDVIRDIAEFIPLEKGRQLSAAQFLEKFLFDRSMHYNFVHKLSGGEKRRLKLMTVLMSNPNFLILDEPTNGLDPEGIQEIRDLLRGLANNGTTVFVSSHPLSELEIISDYIVMLRKGEVVFAGKIEELLLAQQHVIITKGQNQADLEKLVSIATGLGHTATIRNNEVHVQASADFAATLNRAAFDAGITLAQLSPQVPNLEETFFEMTGDK